MNNIYKYNSLNSTNNKYKVKYSNLKKSNKSNKKSLLFSSIEPIISDIINLFEEEHILGISIFQTDDNIYILIGESHHKLEKETNKSFYRIYKDMIGGKYSINNIDVFVESQINLEPLINTKNLSEYKFDDNERTDESFRRITNFKPVNNLNINPHYIDIRDNSIYFWLDLAFRSNSEEKNEIIKNIFILINDNYIRYLKKLIESIIIEIKNKEKVKNLMDFINYTTEFLINREEIFETNKIITYDELSFLSGLVINPYILAKIYSTKSPIKIFYGGLNHITMIDKELKEHENIQVYFSKFKDQ